VFRYGAGITGSVLLLMSTCSIQEGLIFVSMTSDELLERTARYKVREASSPQVLFPENFLQTERPTLPVDLAREPNGRRPPSRRIGWIDGAVAQMVPPPISYNTLYSENHPQGPLTSFQPNNDINPTRRAPFQPNSVSFTVTTDCDDHSGDEEEESSLATLADRIRRDNLDRTYESSSEDTEDGGRLENWVTNRALALGLHPSQRRSRRRADPSRIEIAESQSDENQDELQENTKAGILTPHARFFIEMAKSQVSIKFEPPV
jgi:hypothetical protein